MTEVPSFDLSGRVAVISGGANGIGRAIALAFGQHGADVFFSYRADIEAALDVSQRLAAMGVRTGHLQLDGDDDGAAIQLINEAEESLGSPDILVNNAAFAARTSFLNMSLREYDRTLNVNLRFPFFALQRFASRLIETGRTGSVINVSSISAFKAISKLSAYQTSKAGLAMLTKSAAYELAPHGIRVNSISPGLTATKSNRDQWRDNPQIWEMRGKDIPLGRSGIPSDLAGGAVFLASEASTWMTGADLIIDGGDSVI